MTANGGVGGSSNGLWMWRKMSLF